MAGAQSKVLCEERQVLLFVSSWVASVLLKQSPEKKKKIYEGICTSPLIEHLLYGNRQSKGSMPHGSIPALFKIGHSFS